MRIKKVLELTNLIKTCWKIYFRCGARPVNFIKKAYRINVVEQSVCIIDYKCFSYDQPEQKYLSFALMWGTELSYFYVRYFFSSIFNK